MKRRTLLGLPIFCLASWFPRRADANSNEAQIEEVGIRPVVTAANRSSPPTINRATVRVIGIGGAGQRSVDKMIREGVRGVEFICIDTDTSSLGRSKAASTLLLGSGYFAAEMPTHARNCALRDKARIVEALRGAEMVIVVTGMGGATGTAVSPVVAQIASDLGILTLAMVTLPFEFEGKRRNTAVRGCSDLSLFADSLAVFDCNRKVAELGDGKNLKAYLSAIDNDLLNAVKGIAEIVTVPGLVNVDIDDVRTAMSGSRGASVSTLVALRLNRPGVAAVLKRWMRCFAGLQPGFEDCRAIMVSISAGQSLAFRDVMGVIDTIRSNVPEDTLLIFGAVHDETLGDNMRVTLVTCD